jgi:hypothetical protein
MNHTHEKRIIRLELLTWFNTTILSGLTGFKFLVLLGVA